MGEPGVPVDGSARPPLEGATDFDAVYRTQSNPFGVGALWYERRKEQVLLACLAREDYLVAWDCACGTGHLARSLAARCRQVLATDSSPRAVELTTDLTGDVPHVRAAVSTLPGRPEDAAGADLTVVAEVLYYLPDEARAAALAMLAEQSGELVGVHWRHHPGDAYLSGAAVTVELDSALTGAGWTRTVRHDDVDFVLGAWHRTDAP